KLIPFPQLSVDEYRAMTLDPGKSLKYDYLLPAGPAGTVRAGFPSTLSLLKVLGNYRIQAKLRGGSFWGGFYTAEHPSQALKITTLIMQSFERDSKTSGKMLIVIMFPWTEDLGEYQKHKVWVYQPLIDELRSKGIEVFNIGEGMAKHLGTRSPCDLYWGCVGAHFNLEGNEVTARLIAQYL